jgi:ectoine hydroxylase-related dioxygenase (phytanoyl-CoA dioxygenase family)
VFWRRDYFDRFVRNEKHFETVRAYIESNPVTAGLTSDPTSWRFSSASCVGVDADAPHCDLPLQAPL